MIDKTICEDVADLISLIKKPESSNIILCKDNIKSIAKKCRQTPLYQSNSKEVEEYLNQFQGTKREIIEKIYLDFIYKSAESPTMIHAKGCAILLIPILDDLITKEGGMLK